MRYFRTTYECGPKPVYGVMDNGVRPPSPVLARPQAVLIARSSDKQCAPAAERSQCELAGLRNVIAIQMLRADRSVQARLSHRRRRFCLQQIAIGEARPKQPRVL
jgi:hypothetical protein